MKNRKRTYSKLALTLSLCLMVVWSMLGTGTSLAWFTDTSPVLTNRFYFGDLDLLVSYRQPDGSYKEVTAETNLFDDQALYEPGYVQVVYLKIENKGDVPFDYQTAVDVTDFTPAVNALGYTFQLQDYLRFGMVTADSYAALRQTLATRDLAKDNATANLPLNTYTTAERYLAPDGQKGDEEHLALIVRMPEEVGNAANYRGDTVPEVVLGLTVKATQQK